MEILAHLQNVLVQFWREPDKPRINQLYGNVCIVQIIKSFPNDMTELGFIRNRLLKEIDQIETVREELEQLPETPPLLDVQEPQEHCSMSCCYSQPQAN